MRILTYLLFLTFSLSIYAQRLNKFQTFGPINIANNIAEDQNDNPDLAEKFEFEKTKDPALGYIPIERRAKARKKAMELLAQKTAIPDVHWVERGPNNVGGRTRAIMFDPNDDTHKKVWAGGTSGGLWYNNDITSNSSQWIKVDDFWDNLAISCIDYNPDNTDEFYVGTGEGWSFKLVRGNGIWKTSDGGNTWNRLSSTVGNDFHYVQKIKVLNNGKVIAATGSGLFVSDNGGNTWVRKLTGFFADIEISANQDVYVSEGSRLSGEGYIYKSIDGAESFTDITPPAVYQERIELACAPSNNNVVYAIASSGRNVAWIMRTDDGGSTWSNINIPNYLNQDCSESTSDFTRGQAWYDLIAAVHPTNSDYIIIGGIDLHRSTDGGSSWEAISYWTGACGSYVHADQHAIVFRPDNSNEIVSGCDGGVFYSPDAGNNGTTFNQRDNNYNVTQFYACAMRNEANSNIFFAGAQDNGTQKFSSPGLGSTVKVTGGDGGFCFVDQDNNDFVITSYVYNNHYFSNNGGNSFNYLTSDNSGRFINPADFDNTNNIMYNADQVDSLFVVNINNSSNTHYLINNGLDGDYITAIEASPYTDYLIFAGTYHNIYKITSASTNPTSQNIDPNNTLPDGYISCITVGQDDNHLLVTYSSYGVSHVWTTSDGGNTWVDKTAQLPDMPVRWALFNPNDYNQVLLATEAGVWSTTNLSATDPDWQPTTEGLANVRCDMLTIRSSDNLVAIATYGRGLYTTDVFSAPEPVVSFSANRTITCTVDTIRFSDFSTKQPNAWTWTFSPNTITYVNGTNANSQNPEVIFNQSGTYTVSLTASNDAGSGSLTKNNYIQVNNDCYYIMDSYDIYTCNATYYDPGYQTNYENNSNITQTIYPETPGNNIQAEFIDFSLEAESNCNYDYLAIYDGTSTSAPLIGKFCGTNSPGTVTATNSYGALTFEFFSDTYTTAGGWQANISCLSTNIDKTEQLNKKISIYPNPAQNYVDINLNNNKFNEISLYNSIGENIYNTNNNSNIVRLDVSTLHKGVYFIKLKNSETIITKKLIVK